MSVDDMMKPFRDGMGRRLAGVVAWKISASMLLLNIVCLGVLATLRLQTFLDRAIIKRRLY